jgi:hypothetical protein
MDSFMNTFFKSTVLLACIVYLPPVSISKESIDVLVIIEAEPNLKWDACAAGGMVKLNHNGFLSVRSGPGVEFYEVDRVYDGQSLRICQETGQWFGVVYSRGNSKDCQIENANEARPYGGPCKSGWVTRRYVGDISG